MTSIDLATIRQDFESQGLHVIAQLESWAQATPDAVAIYYGEDRRELTYADVNQMTNRLAAGLQGLGVKKGDKVSVLMRNNLYCALSMLAIWKLGAVYSAINNAYQGELLAYIINDTQPNVLITEQCFVDVVNQAANLFATLPAVVVRQPKPREHDYDTDDQAAIECHFQSCSLEGLMPPHADNPGIELTAADEANIIYTSGTTGRPKGVVQTHRWMQSYCYILNKFHAPDEVIYSDLPMYHVIGAVANTVGALWVGSKLALWDRFSPNGFWDRVREARATRATLLDVMMDWLLKAPESPQDRNHSLRTAFAIPLPADHHKVACRFGIDLFGSAYGSSETSAPFISFINQMPGETLKPAQWRSVLPTSELLARIELEGLSRIVFQPEEVKHTSFIGCPLHLVETRLVDDGGNDVGIDQPGNLVLRYRLPHILFKEYYNKPELTAELKKGGWFYAPDMLKVDKNGIYHFCDRKQGFLRVKGENVAATLVEEEICRHPAVDRAVVVGIPASEGRDNDIAAFVIPAVGKTLVAAEVLAWTDQAMPSFMRPKYVRVMGSFPVTPTFKIEKYKLKEILLAELKC